MFEDSTELSDHSDHSETFELQRSTVLITEEMLRDNRDPTPDHTQEEPTPDPRWDPRWDPKYDLKWDSKHNYLPSDRVVELRPSAISEFRANLMETVDELMDKLDKDAKIQEWKLELALLRNTINIMIQEWKLGIEFLRTMKQDEKDVEQKLFVQLNPNDYVKLLVCIKYVYMHHHHLDISHFTIETYQKMCKITAMQEKTVLSFEMLETSNNPSCTLRILDNTITIEKLRDLILKVQMAKKNSRDKRKTRRHLLQSLWISGALLLGGIVTCLFHRR